MANEKHLIKVCDATRTYNGVNLYMAENAYLNDTALDVLKMVSNWLYEERIVDAIVVPCRIGDVVWAIRSFGGHKHPQRGIVSDMFFTKDMKLMIVVKYIARGEWGKTVFATEKEAYAAIGERKDVV